MSASQKKEKLEYSRIHAASAYWMRRGNPSPVDLALIVRAVTSGEPLELESGRGIHNVRNCSCRCCKNRRPSQGLGNTGGESW